MGDGIVLLGCGDVGPIREPLEDFGATREIQRRVKQGRFVPERSVEFPSIPGEQ